MAEHGVTDLAEHRRNLRVKPLGNDPPDPHIWLSYWVKLLVDMINPSVRSVVLRAFNSDADTFDD